MSSIVRAYQKRKEGVTRFVKADSPCYSDSGTNRLFPFTFTDGELDISYSGNTFKTRMVDNTGVSPINESGVVLSVSSGPYLVTSLGSNFKQYIRAWRNSSFDPNSPIEIYVKPQVIRVQEADNNNINAINTQSWRISIKPPSSDNYISGNEENSYRTTYVFKTPLTFTVIESGVKQYITFHTVLDQE